ncbi:unnamed protein product, partial [Cladocopium goreaui]
MAAAPREASLLIHSTAALRERAAKAGLSSEEVQAILDNNVTSIAQMAFAISPPGASPTEQQVRDFYQSIAVNMGTITIITSTKLLIFEAHTLVVANIKSEVGRKDDVTTHCVLPSAEREGRIQDQQKRLTGLRFKGDEEVAFLAYDLVFTLLEKDTLTYLHPERFITRRFELSQKKPLKQLALDNESLTIKERPADHTCATRAAFLHLAEVITSLKRDANGDLPLEVHLPKVLVRPSVSFHLLPLATHMPAKPAPKANPNNQNKRKHEDTKPPAAKDTSTSKGHPGQNLDQLPAALKGDMSGRRRAILEKKRLLLFKELLVEAGSNDVNLVEDICNGFDLTGKLPEFNQFDKKFRSPPRFRNCMKELNSHVNRGFRKITDEFATALELMSELLESNLLRPVDVNFTDWVHVYVDASFEPGKYSGLGGLVLDSSGQCLGCFSEVSQELVSKIKREDQQTVIFELEGLAIAVALEVFKEHIKGKRLVVFTDNSGAQ